MISLPVPPELELLLELDELLDELLELEDDELFELEELLVELDELLELELELLEDELLVP